jgi:hypothetical protein
VRPEAKEEEEAEEEEVRPRALASKASILVQASARPNSTNDPIPGLGKCRDFPDAVPGNHRLTSICR